MYSLLTFALAAFLNLAVFTTSSRAQSFVYPMNNQSPQQQEQDEFSCYKWAKGQTGTDPTRPSQAAAAPPPKRKEPRHGVGSLAGGLSGHPDR